MLLLLLTVACLVIGVVSLALQVITLVR